MAGNILAGYNTSSALTVTSLHSLASSSDWTAGWSSASTSNLVNKYLDYLYAFRISTNAANRQAGSINIYVIASLDDAPTWPFSASGTPGTQGALSFTDTEERDGICVPILTLTADATAGASYERGQFGIAQFFGGVVPTHHAIFIAQNCSTTTTAGLSAAGSAVYQTGVYGTYT